MNFNTINDRYIKTYFDNFNINFENKIKKIDTSFNNIIEQGLNSLSNLEKDYEVMKQEFIENKRDDVHNILIKSEQVNLYFTMANTLRNKILELYQELSRTQF